jgi:hypothetical protein
MRTFPLSSQSEFSVFKKLNSPEKIQDFLNSLPFNFEKGGDTMRSPQETLRTKKAHCLEGALLAAAILWYHGEQPLLLDLETTHKDQSHVVALFKRNGLWGAISKTNHAVLRYRDPVYTTVRELVLSYFNEYFLDTGIKTLRTYSRPFSLLTFTDDWLTTSKSLWHIEKKLIASPHVRIAPASALNKLRRADAVEIKTGKITEWKQ